MNKYFAFCGFVGVIQRLLLEYLSARSSAYVSHGMLLHFLKFALIFPYTSSSRIVSHGFRQKVLIIVHVYIYLEKRDDSFAELGSRENDKQGYRLQNINNISNIDYYYYARQYQILR